MPLDALWGDFVFSLRDQLLAAPSPAAQFRLLKEALCSRLSAPPVHHSATLFALDAFEQTDSVAAVAEQAGLKARRLQQLFADEVGLSPKRYQRVRRFQRVLDIVGNRPVVDWVDIALATGYTDQAHLIHEFRALAGLTPTAYLERRNGHRNHVVLGG